MATKNLLIRGGADFSKMKKAMDDANKRIVQFKQQATRQLNAIGAAMAAIGAAVALAPAVKDAMEFEAAMGTIQQTMGSATDSFVEWMNTTGRSMGMSKLQLAKYGNQYSLTLKGIAKDEQDLANKTIETIKAVAIVRSKTGMDVTEISDRMRSAMNGEADGADELGVNVRVAAIEASKAYQMMANGQPFSDLSAEMQKAIRWQYTMDTITQNLGNTMANNTSMKMAVFTAGLSNMRLALGQAWLPILNIALPALTKLANGITRVLTIFAKFMSALFGYEVDTSAGGGLAQQTDEANNLGGAVGDVGDAYKKAGKEAKKAKGALAGFDEVNTLAEPTTDSGAGDAGAGAGGAGGGGMGVAPTFDTSGADGALGAISQKIQDFAQKFKDFMSPAINALKTAWGAVTEYFKQKGAELVSFWKENGSMIVKAFQNIWAFCKPIVMFIVKFVWDSVKGLIDGCIKFFEGLMKFIGGVFTGDWGKAWEGMKDMFFGAIQAIWNFFNLSFVGGIKKALVEIVENGAKFFLKFADDFTANITKAIQNVTTGVSNFIKGLVTFFKDFGKWLDDHAVNIAHGVIDSFNKIGAVGTSIWNAIKTAFNGAVEWFARTIITPIVNRFEDIKEAFSTGIGNGLKAVINTIAEPINTMISALNKVKGKIPGMGGIPDIPRIPALAKGGITNGPTLALIGDNPGGKEVVSPLDKLTDIVASAVGTAVTQAMQYSRPQSNGGDIILNLDGRTFGRIIKPFVDAENQRVGKNVILNPI